MITNSGEIILSIIIIIGSAFFGYCFRLLQKFQDRRDDIYLVELPYIYNLIKASTNSLNLYQKNKYFSNMYKEMIIVNEKIQVFFYSGKILIFERFVYIELQKLHRKINDLLIIMDQINNDSNREDETDNFSNAFQSKIVYEYGDNLSINPSQLLEEAESFEKNLEEKIDLYSSDSTQTQVLMIAIFVVLIIILFYFISHAPTHS